MMRRFYPNMRIQAGWDFRKGQRKRSLECFGMIVPHSIDCERTKRQQQPSRQLQKADKQRAKN
jgi:hypothetical protein